MECPGQEVRRINGDRINGLFHLLINGLYWGYNPLILTIDPNFLGHLSSSHAEVFHLAAEAQKALPLKDFPNLCRDEQELKLVTTRHLFWKTFFDTFFPKQFTVGFTLKKKRGVHRLARACSVGRGVGVAWACVAWAWRGRGLGVAWAWRGRGVGVAWAWLGRGVGVAWARLGRGRGLGVAWAWLGRGVGVAWAWLGRGVGVAWAWLGRGVG